MRTVINSQHCCNNIVLFHCDQKLFHLIINHSNKSIFESILGSSFTERDFNLLGGSSKMLLIIQLDNNKIIIYYSLIINLCIYFGN